MKKILLIVLCLSFVFGLFSVVAFADANYCDLFETSIRSLRWPIDLNGQGNVEEGNSFDLDVILDHVKDELYNDYYSGTGGTLEIPAEAFETTAKKHFAVVDVNALRAHKISYWDTTTSSMQERLVYNADKNAYVFAAAGGVGDSTTYVIKGYVKNGNKYTVHSYFIDMAGGDVAEDAVLGKDYIVFEGFDGDEVKTPILHCLINVVETDGKIVKFHSWVKTDSLPELSGMIYPSTVIPEEKPVESSKPTTTTDSSSQTQSTTQETASSKEQTTSEETTTTTSSDTSSTVVKETVTVAETDTVKLETEKGVFPENTVVDVKVVEDKRTIKDVKQVLKDVSERFVVYEITATSENVSVQPNGKVNATFEIPEGYDPAKVIVVYVSDDGFTELIPSTVNADDNTVVAELSHFSKYVVAETKDDADIDTIGTEDDKNSGNGWVWIVIAVVVLGAAAGWYFLYYKKVN